LRLYAGWQAVVGTSLGWVLVALLAFVDVMRNGRWRDYGLLGLALGAGLLSKYVFAGFIAALVLGALATRGGRQALGSRRLLLTVAAMLAVILPVALAGADQWAALAEIFKMRTTQVAPSAGLPARLAEVLALVSQIVVFALVPLLAMGAAIAAGILFRSTDPATGQNTRADSDMFRLLVAVVLAGIVIVFVGVLAGAVERVSGRFLLAFLLPVPFVIVAVARRTSPVRAGLRCGGIAIAVVLLAQAGVRIIDLTPYCSRKCTDLAPYDGLAERLREAGFTHGAVTATEVSVAGNIVAALPGSVVTVRGARRIVRPWLPSRRRCLLIWRRRDAKSAQPPLPLINASGLAPTDAESRVRVIEVPWRWASRDRFKPFAPGTRRISSWGTILLRRGEGSCR